MKPHALALAAAATVFSIGTAFAYHPVDRNVRGTLEQEQRERIDFEDVQRGSFRGGPFAAMARQPAAMARQPARSIRRGADAAPPYLTEHHTR